MRISILLLVVFAVLGCALACNAKKPTRKTPDPIYAQAIEKLTPLQRRVTQSEGTEPPFRNAFWNNKRQGIYVDIVSGEPLFSSTHKFRSGTGWPSFSQPLVPTNVVDVSDTRLGMRRVEVRSRAADSHLGHVFTDGPAPSGLRYCINSAAMRFIPVDRLEAEGLGTYRKLFSSMP